ncbi:MAG: tryptophan 7-halogenase [Massilia sp.]|nr:tryptophan 7-halogenase [Massilia sp.]
MRDRWIRRVVIVGGGTAGWMAAAALSQILGREVALTLVESDAIGTIGVGEIPPIRSFHDLAGINEAEFIRETFATFKLGIEFRNWSSLGSQYFHPFGTYGTQKDLGYFLQYWLRLAELGRVADISAFSLATLAARKNVMAQASPDANHPLYHFSSAYHFDASLYARYLKSLSVARGVTHKLGDIIDAEKDPASGFVTALRLKSGETVEGDLFIDCSGFRGALIDKVMGSPYEDWSKWLPMDRAIAMPCDRTLPLTPYTVSTAHAFGWQWRIPLQHRVGNGVVYASSFVSDETAEETLVANLESTPLASANRIRFTTGRRKTPWNKNVVAIGLSSGFLEPLESTSIYLIQSSIQRLIKHFPDRTFSPVNIDAYNMGAAAEIETVRDFLILHYCATERNDSELWNYVRTMPIPDSLAHRIDLFRERGQLNLAAEELFQSTSWLAVLMGQGIRPRSYMPTMAFQDDDLLAEGYARLERYLKNTVERMPDHLEFLRAGGLVNESLLAAAN